MLNFNDRYKLFSLKIRVLVVKVQVHIFFQIPHRKEKE